MSISNEHLLLKHLKYEKWSNSLNSSSLELALLYRTNYYAPHSLPGTGDTQALRERGQVN